MRFIGRQTDRQISLIQPQITEAHKVGNFTMLTDCGIVVSVTFTMTEFQEEGNNRCGKMPADKHYDQSIALTALKILRIR